MNEQTYRKLRLVDMQARRWRTNCELSNMQVEIPAGTIVAITAKDRGNVTIEAVERCPHCGVRPIMSRVPAGDVDELEAAS